jgi:hypothetical protein
MMISASDFLDGATLAWTDAEPWRLTAEYGLSAQDWDALKMLCVLNREAFEYAEAEVLAHIRARARELGLGGALAGS